MKCFYHVNDHDGNCSKEIIRLRYPNCEMIGVNYGDKTDPLALCAENEFVFVIDFCFQPFTVMEELSRKCNLVVYDHHKSAIDMAKESKKFKPKDVCYKLDHSACEITWLKTMPDEPMPNAIKLLGRYDIFDLSYSPDVLPFEYGLRCFEPLDQKVWTALFSNSPSLIGSIIEKGKMVLKYIEVTNRRLVSSLKKIKFEGYQAFALNYNGDDSLFFRQYQDELFQSSILLSYKRKDNQWHVGLISKKEDNIDVGEIAKKYGGGGHVTCAGFVASILPFDI